MSTRPNYPEMKFKIRKIGQAAVIVSVILAALIVAATLLYGIPWWASIAAGAVIFALSYWLSMFFFGQYVIFRIKPLYQLLLSRDIITSRLSDALRRKVDDDLVDDIQENLNHLVALSDDEIERLRQKDEEMDEFLTAVFHEIRTPVFNIEGYTQTLLDGAVDDPAINRKYLERTLRSAHRLMTAVEDIDRLSRYESGGAIMYKQPFDIVELVREVIDDNILASQARGIVFRIDKATFPARRPIMVYADRMRIGQVLDNLLSNAIRYSPEHGTVTVSFVDMYDKILVEVEDTGIGIAPRDLHRVFGKFYRADKSRSRESGGLGLGLAGVKRIIDCHDENVTVRSQLGVGTTFSFTIRKYRSHDSR